MTIKINTSAIPHRYRNRFLRDTGNNVSVSGGGGNITNNTTIIGSTFEPHNLWGRYFDDTEDISGDLEGVGNIDATGNITTTGNITGEDGSFQNNLDVVNYIHAGGDIEADEDILGENVTAYNEVNGTTGNFNTVNAETGNITIINSGTINADEGNITRLSSDYAAIKEAVIDTLRSTDITTDYLTVTKQAHFFSLIIDELKSVGGQVILTPANMKVSNVWHKTNGDYRLYARAKQGDKQITNNFVVGDQVICQTFNAATGTSYNVSNKYYWALVKGIGTKRNMYFQSPSIKATCVANFDTEGDGEITHEEAQAVTGSLGTIFKNNCEGKFNELQYFTGLTYINTAAFESSKIEEVTLPSTITRVYKQAFRYCRNLSSVTLNNGLTRIDNSAFRYCTILPEITIPSTVTTIESLAFSRCALLHTVTFKSTNPSNYQADIFSDCESLETIYVPSSAVATYKAKFPTLADIIVADTSTTALTANTEPVLYEEYFYIDIDGTDYDGTLNPEEGDEVVQLGYRGTDDAARQSAIIISAYRSVDTGLTAPSYAQYKGINNYSLSTHRYTWFAANGNCIRGDLKVETGESIDDIIDDIELAHTYVHVAYANSSTDWSKTYNKTYTYIGFCSNQTESDTALVYSDYRWSRMKGVNGSDAEYYKLVPNYKQAYINKNKQIKFSASYNIAHIVGDSYEILDETDAGLFNVEYKLNTAASWSDLGQEPDTDGSFHYAETVSNYNAAMTGYYIRLYSEDIGDYIDNDYIPVTMEAGAVFEVTDEAITSAVTESEEYTDGKIATVNNRCSTIEQTASGITTRVEDLETDYDTLSGTVSSHTTSISQVEQTASSLSTTVSQHTTTLGEHTTSISNLTQTANGLTSKVGVIDGELCGDNMFGFNRGSRSYNTNIKLSPEQYGMIGWGTLNRIDNLGITETGWYTVSFDIKASSSCYVNTNLCDTPSSYAAIWINGALVNDSISSSNYYVTTSFRHIVCQFNLASSSYINGDNGYWGFLDFELSNTYVSNGVKLYVANLSVIKGQYQNPTFHIAREDSEYSGGEQWFEWLYSSTNGLKNTGESYRGFNVYCNETHPTSTKTAIDFIHPDTPNNHITLKDQTCYTLSFFAKTNYTSAQMVSHLYNTQQGVNSGTYLHNSTTCSEYNHMGESGDGYYVTDLTSEWKHYVIHWWTDFGTSTGTRGLAVSTCQCLPLRITTDCTNYSGSVIYIAGVMLQEGYVSDQSSTHGSTIQQTADSIKMVVQGLNDTGIDIQSGTININADNTNFYGNIKLYDSNEGLTIYKGGSPTIKVKNESVGSYSDNKFNNQTITYPDNIVVQPYNLDPPLNSSIRSLGARDAGVTISLTNCYVQLSEKPSFAQSFNYTIHLASSVRTLGNGYRQYNDIATKTGTISMPTSGYYSFGTVTFSALSANQSSLFVTISLEYTGSNPNHYSDKGNQIVGKFYYTLTQTVSNLTTIGIDGMYSSSGQGKMLWANPDNVGMYWNGTGTSLGTSYPYYSLKVNANGMSQAIGTSISNMMDYNVGSVSKVKSISSDWSSYSNTLYFCYPDTNSLSTTNRYDTFFVSSLGSTSIDNYLVFDNLYNSGVQYRSPNGRRVIVINRSGSDRLYICTRTYLQSFASSSYSNYNYLYDYANGSATYRVQVKNSRPVELMCIDGYWHVLNYHN